LETEEELGQKQLDGKSNQQDPLPADSNPSLKSKAQAFLESIAEPISSNDNVLLPSSAHDLQQLWCDAARPVLSFGSCPDFACHSFSPKRTSLISFDILDGSLLPF